MVDAVHIWSGEYNAFYRDGGHGYTTHVAEAGKFKRAVAEDVVKSVGAEKKLAIREIGAVPPDPRDATISALRADLAAAKEEAGLLREALQGCIWQLQQRARILGRGEEEFEPLVKARAALEPKT